MAENKEELIRGIPEDTEDLDEVVDSTLDYNIWLNEPAARKKEPRITKDIPMSNLSIEEMFLARNFADFSKQLETMGLKKAADYFGFQLDFLVNVSLGKKGFARRIDKSVIQDVKVEEKTQEKKFWSLRGGGKGRAT